MSDLITEIHHTDTRCVLAVTGGGTTAISDLLAVPGASRTLLEATVPYNANALSDYIRRKPDQSASESTARQLAMSAYQRARQLNGGDRNVAGIGCTAALTTDRERRGSDRCFLAAQTASQTLTVTIRFNGGTRATQERACSDAVIHLLATIAGLKQAPLVLPDTTIEHDQVEAPRDWQDLLSGVSTCTPVQQPVKLLFPGSFNPLHDGHEAMARIAQELTGASVVLEISTFNVDKPPTDFVDMRNRQNAIGERYPLVFTNAPTFVTKAGLFPGVTFIVGADTITRIGSARYYRNENSYQKENTDPERNMVEGLAVLRESGCRFLVFGRKVGASFENLTSVTIPESLREICDEVPESRFRVDLSSSELRARV